MTPEFEMKTLEERDERLRQRYRDEGWGKLAEAAGFDPVDVESQAREAFRFAYDQIMTWQPIETAPKDGTPILLYSSHAVKQGRLKYTSGCSVDYWHIPKKHGKWSFTGWTKFNHYYWPPTHWMPLPKPPQISQKKQ